MTARIDALEKRRASVTRKSFPDRGAIIPFEGHARNGGIRILHIVPYIYFERGFEFLGSTKDIDGRQEYLWRCGAAFDTFSHLKDRFSLADELSFFDLPDYTHIIVDLSRGRSDLAYIKGRWPGAKLIVRSHNPEVTHRLDYLRAARRTRSTFLEKKSIIANVAVFYGRDRGAAELADAILHIETGNTASYWRALGFHRDILVTPYFTSDYQLRAIPEGRVRKNQIVCVSSTHPGALTVEMVSNFHQAVDSLGNRLVDVAFLATGERPLTIRKDSITPRVHHLGVVEDIHSLLAESFAVAVTSDLGRGFKTKILEAIVCGAWVIVTPGLMSRMPEVLKPFCVVINMASPGDSLARAIEELRARRWPNIDPNAVLRRQAYCALDAAIFGSRTTTEPVMAASTYPKTSTRSAL